MGLQVINFCLPIPASRLSTIAGPLPDSVRWRIGKEHLGRTFAATLLQARAESFRQLTQSPALLRPLVSAKGLKELARWMTVNEICVSLYHL